MSKTNELAAKFRDAQPKSRIGVQVGCVTSDSPYTVEIGGGKIRATGKNLKIAAHLLAGYSREITITTADAQITGIETLAKDVLEPGDKVIVAASENNQIFYVLGKAVYE